MIRGRFSEIRRRATPILTCDIEFPDFPHIGTRTIDLLVDTGADRTTISRGMAESIGLDLTTLPNGGTSTGVGGVSAIRQVRVSLSVQDLSTEIWLRVWELRQPAPSVLGRDFIANFALFMEERTGRVLFLDETDIEMYGLAALGNP